MSHFLHRTRFADSRKVDMHVLSDTSTIPEIKAYLLQSKGFDVCPAQLLQSAAFHDLDNLPAEVQKAWTESTTSPPLRLSAQGCWRSRVPTFQELWLSTSRIPKKGMCSDLLPHAEAKEIRHQGFRARTSGWRAGCCVLPACRTRLHKPYIYCWCTANIVD
jgi:hypothetical protein